MTTHSFDVEVAAEVGVNAAVIFQNIVFWCQRNAANGENIFEGRAWTYNSNKALVLLFPYMTSDQIRRALERLVEAGLVGVGNFNADPWNRTKWFCVLRHVHLAQMPMTSGADAKSYRTDINTDINTDKNIGAQDEQRNLFSDEATDHRGPENQGVGATATKPALEAKFSEFWNAYPVKSGKPAAMKAFQKAVKAGTDPDLIIAGAARYRAWLSSAAPGEFRPQAKYPQGWLNDERWNDLPAEEEIDPARARLQEITRQALAAMPPAARQRPATARQEGFPAQG